jgi:uncharacterized membrane protein YbhN (UPF0104 family)
MKQRLKQLLAIALLLATVGAFAYYARKHPGTLEQLKHLSPPTLLLLLGLYAVSFGAYALVTRGSLFLYGKTLSRQENILFNAYSSLINFFGPGQSGPVFRGAYLKKRHNLGIKQYVFATLLYYGFFAVLSILCMFAGARPWWQTALVVAAAAVASWLVVRWYKGRADVGAARLDLRHVGWIGAATVLQIAAQVGIFALELHSINAHASFGQVLSYTGVANLAVFVALTPGAIGIREAFLLFSERLHHIGSSAIVAAGVLDRGVYLVFLSLLFVLVLSLHARDKLHVSDLTHEGGDNHATQR